MLPKKLSQEFDSTAPPSLSMEAVPAEEIQSSFPEIAAIRQDFVSEGISLLIISVKKSRKHQIRLLATDLLKNRQIGNVKFVLFVDSLLDLNSLSQIVWISANNIDPIRDCFHIESEPGIKVKTLFIDATRKSREFDDFQRDWPNVTVMDEKTIHSVDEKWPRLELGPLIPSPSHSYKVLNINFGAIS